MNRILLGYLAREIYGATLTVLLAFLGLFAFFDFVNELDSIGKNGYQAYHALAYVAMLIPTRTYELLPVAVLIGSLYALTTLARHSEITVMRASGLSTGRMLGMLCLVGLMPVALTHVLGEYIAPPAESAAQQWRLTSTNSTISQQLRSGLWVKDGARVINVRTLQPDRSMERVRVFAFDEAGALSSIAEAARGVYVEANEKGRGYWRLTDVTRTDFFDDHATLASPDEMLWESALTPEVLSVLMVQPERMSVAALLAYIGHLQENQQSANRYEIALWKKLAAPLASLVMMILALPFALTHERSGGVSVKVFLGVMLGVAFYLLNGMFSSLGMINSWPPPIAAITPSLLFLAAAAAMLYMVERR
ncbi:MAG: LPS export ABC transporter permease LptG [Betaproteobacteria bacterium]|jgi:lipopolysaccharide export system permease protein|nr:LPS export ABC transporter permease LptG [Betaproteobacteria bacterium]